MSINNKFTRLQQHNIHKHIKNSDLNTFFNLLNPPDFASILEETQPKHRKRIYPPSATLSLYLTQTLNSDSSKPGLGFPICHIVGVICLSSDTILNMAIGQYKGKGGSEQTLLRQLLTTFNAGDLVIDAQLQNASNE